MAAADLTPERLRELLHYDPETGVFTRRVATGYRGCHRAGTVAGSVNTKGYVVIGIGRTDFLAHRLAWLYVFERWPEGQIDHRDGHKANNAIKNLRDGSHNTNQQNRRAACRNNSSGLLGVSFDRSRESWRAEIRANGKRLQLGRFRTPEEAHAAYVAAKRALHPGNTL